MKCLLLVSLLFSVATSAYDDKTCSGHLSAAIGSFTSPVLQSGNYPDKAKCKWTIDVPKGGNVTINFVKFHTEACCDYVKISNENGAFIGQYSGKQQPFAVTVTSANAKRIDIIFQSDVSQGHTGFQANYVIYGRPTTAPPTTSPTTMPVSGIGHSLMDALLKMTSSLTMILNAVISSSDINDTKDKTKLKSELYQALKSLEHLKKVASPALSKHENEQINLALVTIADKARRAVTKLERRLTSVVCSLPKFVGPCRAMFPRYFYNDTSEQCELFHYGGCQGNGNNFAKLKDCKEVCVRTRICPKGVPVVNCFADPCSVSSCPAYIVTSRCVSNYCGGCNAVFYDQYNITIPSNRCHCQPNESTVQCAGDPCKFATCAAHPTAKCRARRCGACTAEFVKDDGSIVQKC